MQLPPTILSLDKHEKKNKQAKLSEKQQRKNGSESEVASTKLSKPDESKASSTDDGQEDATESTSETSSESGSGSIYGDVAIAEEITVPAADKPENSSKPPKKKSSKRSGLRPPRTLETTLFDRLERMYGPGIKRLLNVQYRYASNSSTFVLARLTVLEDARSNLPVSVKHAVWVQAKITRLGILTFALRFTEHAGIF